MDRICLRKLSRKSVFDFGKFQGQSVQQVIDLNHQRILRWYYYNLSNISFLDDILEEIGITEDWRIEKPGKNSEKGEELNKLKDEAQYVYKGMALKTQDKKRMGKIAHQNKIKKNKKKVELILFEKEDSVKFSKENLQRINHGHKPSI